MGMPWRLQAAMTSSSRRLPPGWMMAAIPAAAAAGPIESSKGKKGIGGQDAAAGLIACLLEGDLDRVDAAHLAGADAGEGAVVRDDDRVALHEPAGGPGEAELVVEFRGGVNLGDDLPFRRFIGEVVGVLGEHAAVDLAELAGAVADGKLADAEQADVVAPLRLRGEDVDRVGVELGSDDRFDELARLGEVLGHRGVDGHVDAEDRAESTERVAVPGLGDRFAEGGRGGGAAGVVVL